MKGIFSSAQRRIRQMANNGKAVFASFANRNRSESEAVIVTFTGGLGAQILSAAIYFSLKRSALEVYADLSYFDLPHKVAESGRLGQCSHWRWELSAFGLEQSAFNRFPSAKHPENCRLLEDGPDKFRAGIVALKDPLIREIFHQRGPTKNLPIEVGVQYLCIHIRRGDYLNVASLVIEDGVFLSVAQKFCGLLTTLVVLSDSPISNQLREKLISFYPHALFLDHIDAFSAHSIMRKARVLVCSNSQFSLTAALLNPTALILTPHRWFGPGQECYEIPIHEECEFELLS